MLSICLWYLKQSTVGVGHGERHYDLIFHSRYVHLYTEIMLFMVTTMLVPTYPPVNKPTYLSINLPVYKPINLPTNLSINLPTYLYINLAIYLAIPTDPPLIIYCST